ncbi:unnamed protein product [Adineta steineri]|uniref:Uncharacterized protein n=1 Tax=Adineta steineri TaxID=433720 RepID=A0A814QCR7_9BILA|nr:unnamed protein product [Adineta steineri]CAF1117498.1 unnamed protein product [Adineta steineri]CAF3788517.1 unnamed protein product [Adineta steineri]CAF4156027.1 unnamed protein product [Adineta steineri]
MEAPHRPTPPAPPVEHKGMRCGAPTEPRELDDHDKALFEEFRDIIEQKLREQFDIPKDYKIEPTQVQAQAVAGSNYYFHARLPNNKFAHVRVFKPLKGHALEASDRSTRVHVEKETHDD